MSTTAALFALATHLAAPDAMAQATLPAIDLQAGEENWLDSPVPGVRTAVLSGNLLQPGLYILRVRIAKDAKLMPHTHPDVRYTTVLSGEMLFGFGESFDPGRMKAYHPGAIIAIPANTPHYVWARTGEVVVQDVGSGPTATAPVRK